MKKKLAILGGMGPKATQVFYERIIEQTLADVDQEHIWTIISSHTTLPDRSDIILKDKDEELFLNPIKKDIELFKLSDVGNIAIPCNTSHYFYDDVQFLAGDIPVINMVKETLKRFRKSLGRRLVVLSSIGTYQAKIYEANAEDMDLDLIRISVEQAENVHDVIYNIKASQKTRQPEFFDLLEDLNNQYQPDGFILACTELSLIDDLETWTNPPLIDAMDVLVKESIVRSGYSYKG